MTTDVFIENTAAMATISVQIPGGEYITRVLREGQTVSVGADGTAELRLESEGVAGLHCLLSVIEGVVNVRDCYSPTGTYVDGVKVQDIDLDYNCEVRVGDNTIELNLRNSQPKPEPNTYTPVEVVTEVEEESGSESTEVTDSTPPPIQLDDLTELTSHLPSPDQTEKITALTNELEETQAEVEVLRERLASRKTQSPLADAADPFQQEMIELLREEVLSLQEELSKREVQAHPEAPVAMEVFEEDLPTREEVEKLVDRLETLLSELHQKDENIQLLQDLVLAADNANQAEKEEREQVARWLGEFEQRFELLSEEWQAENEQLKKKLKSIQNERYVTEAALAADTTSAKTEALQRLIENLREQIVALQQEVDAANKNAEKLKQEVKEAAGTVSREEEIRLSKERAEIARMRHDMEVRLQKAQLELDVFEKDGVELDEAELKLREFREHVRGNGKTKNSSQSLSSRLIHLWSRLG